MLADVLEPHDLSILNAALSAEPFQTDPGSTRPVTPPQTEHSRGREVKAARGTAAGRLIGATFWLVTLVVACVGH